MPYTFNGCGTRYCGERDRAEDGSYITTEWIALVHIPLVPIRSCRVRPVGKGTNILIHSSQSYQTLRVPLCWRQVRNVYLCVSPILLLILYFSAPDIKRWWKKDVTKSAATQPYMQPEPPQAQPVEADLPLNSKDAAVACGKALKLDKAAFEKLDLIPRLSKLVDDSGFTDAELKGGLSGHDLEESAFSSYSLAYLTWDKTEQTSREDFDNMVIKVAHSVGDSEKLSLDDRAMFNTYLAKFKRMMVRAFDMGRHDARTSPCPF